MINEHDFDVVVLGSGPGGEGAAMQAAKGGLKVALIEKMVEVGGHCTHSGTIPSKTLRHSAYRWTLFKNDPFFQRFLDQRQANFSDFLQKTNDVVQKQVERRKSHYDRNHVKVFEGKGLLENPNSVYVETGTGQNYRLSCKAIILATGSRPYRPDFVDFTHPRVFDSDTIFSLNENPRIVTVYGAGVIGCEYTSIFRSLDKKVNLINTKSKLLNFLDDEISDALSYHLRDQGVIIRNSETCESVAFTDTEVVLNLTSGKHVKSDILLVAVGRVGNSEGIGLEKVGVKVSSRGHVLVNEHYQTNIPNIYAVGDLSGFPSLASAAYDQGRFAVRHILDPNTQEIMVKQIPVGIYTSPEISCIGKTEAELTEAKIPYEVGQTAFRHLARAQIINQMVGTLKILFHSETLEILGIHCFGHNAAEIIHIGQAIMAQKGENNTLKYFINTTFNYPTMAEAYRVAALNGINRLCDEKIK